MTSPMIEVLVGAPGSGKTRYARLEKEKIPNKIILDADDWLMQGRSFKDLIDYLKYYKTADYIIVDGLFGEKEVTVFNRELINCEITLFVGDKELCIANDDYRFRVGERTSRAINSIRNYNAPYQSSSYKKVEIKTPLPLVNKAIGYLTSENWDAGGSTYASCWDDENTVYEESCEEEEPGLENFYELIEFVKQYEDMTNKEIIETYGHLVEIENDSEADYYGGCVYYYFYKVDRLELLAEILQVPKYISEEEMKIDYPGAVLKLIL